MSYFTIVAKDDVISNCESAMSTLQDEEPSISVVYTQETIVEIWRSGLIRVVRLKYWIQMIILFYGTGLKVGLIYYITQYLESSIYFYYYYLSNTVRSM